MKKRGGKGRGEILNPFNSVYVLSGYLIIKVEDEGVSIGA